MLVLHTCSVSPPLRKLHGLYSNMNDSQQWLSFHWVASDMLEAFVIIAKYFSANAGLLDRLRERTPG